MFYGVIICTSLVWLNRPIYLKGYFTLKIASQDCISVLYDYAI